MKSNSPLHILGHLVLLTLSVALLTGCPRRLPGGGPGAGERDLTEFGIPAGQNGGAGGMELEPLPDGSDIGPWTSTGQAVPDDTAMEARATNERRWEGAAVYFAYDRSTIGAAERPKLETLASFLADHPGYEVVIEGHADSRGSDEYNRGLSERRALAVKNYLADLGVAPGRLQTIAYGEDKPAVPGASAEPQHARNRRVEFVFLIPR